VGDATEETDWIIGEVMTTLKASAAAKDTLVIFTSGVLVPHPAFAQFRFYADDKLRRQWSTATPRRERAVARLQGFNLGGRIS
jgi:hypothetical protein